MNAQQRYQVLMHLWRADFHRLQREKLQGAYKGRNLKPPSPAFERTKAPTGPTSQSKDH